MEIKFDDINYLRVYGKYVDLSERPNDNGDIKVVCPFHEDSEPSLSINMHTGLFRCFGCEKAGDVYTFIQLHEGVDFKRAQVIANNMSLPPISDVIVEGYVEALHRSTKIMKFLLEKRGFTEETISRFRLGWDGSRVTIPIYDENKNIVNIRRYSPTHSGKHKVINYKTGYGVPPRLFPLSALKKSEIWIVEGETDCMLATQTGVTAVTATGGALAWNPGWADLFQGKSVIVCYDIDRSGKIGSEKVARTLSGIAKDVRVIQLPLVDPPDADLTDYILYSGAGLKELKGLIKETPLWHPHDSEHFQELDDDTTYSVHLSQTSMSMYYHKRIRTDAIVAGKTLSPYTVPKIVEFQCPMDMDRCVNCAMADAIGGKKRITIGCNSKWLLELIGVPDSIQRNILYSFIGVGQCKQLRYKIVEAQNVEEITIIPELDFSTTNQEYCMRRAFFIGHGIRSNQAYSFVGLSLPDPKTQVAVLLLSEAKPTQGDISSFKMNPQIRKQLTLFQPGKQSIRDKLHHIYDDFEANVTGIYGRHDLMLTADLAWHSALTFIFQERKIRRGWVETLIIGDSRTGKTETVSTMLNHYRLGEFITGENTSYAGLIGGLQQLNKKWTITWGKLPINNGRLVAIDEVSALSEEDIAAMSGVRSTGVAEITKIQTERTMAQTRTIWMSNPRSARTLNTYTYGILAVRELIGRPEDIARFDFAISAANNEVKMTVINRMSRPRVKHVYIGDACRQLLLWVWSRTAEQVIFEKSAVQAILDNATSMGNKYSSKIPLVEGADQRIKLARLSVALAARLFSTDKGEKIIVKKEHVIFIVEFLDTIYSKQSLSYTQFSDVEQRDSIELKKHEKDIEGFLSQNRELAHIMMKVQIFRARELGEMLGEDQYQVSEYIRFLSQFGLLVRTPNGYVKSAALIQKLHSYLPDIPLKKDKKTKW